MSSPITMEPKVQVAMTARHNFNLAKSKKDTDTMNAIVSYLHESGLSGLADSLEQEIV